MTTLHDKQKEHFTRIKNDLLCALKWQYLGINGIHEPIVDGLYFDDIAKMVIDGLENGNDHSTEVWEKLIGGARDYFSCDEEIKDYDDDDPGQKRRLKERIYEATRPL